MKKRTYTAALLAALAWMVGASAQVPPVEVKLAGGNITVSRDPVEVRRDQGAVVIRWQLPPDADYSFDPTGIVVNGEKTRGGGLRPQDQLPPTCHGGPKHVTCLNKNTKRGEFKYTIQLLDRGRNRVTLDPIIVNQ